MTISVSIMGQANSSRAFYPLILTVLSLVLFYVRSLLDWKARSRGRPLPPGPRPWPLIGNVSDLPRFRPWRRFLELTNTYGDIVHLRVLGEDIIIIGSAEVANELLNKRSANTADRPLLAVIELSGQDVNFATFPYGQWWRRHRRSFWQQFHPGALSRYFPIQREGTHKFLASLLESPSQLRAKIAYTFQGVILKIVYGIDVEPGDERLAIANAALESISQATPGNSIVEVFPFLRHAPSWFPGTGFQKEFAKSKVANYRLKDELFDEVKEAIERGEQRPCVAAELLERGRRIESGPDEEQVMKHVCAVAIEGSSDTTGYTLEGFFLAMAMHPDVQRKARAELDRVVGPNRLPDHSDSDELVYINAIVKEALRWHNVMPLGVWHRTIADDEYNGYFIPSGSMVLTNVWNILHDPNAYENPHDFCPERFIKDGRLDPTVRDPTDYMFGFGRRICPGRHLAIPSLFINIASILHVFDISPPLDDNGQPIPIKYEETHGLLSRPEDLRCTIKPRSSAAEALIREAQRTNALTAGL
ncbi:CyP450 monooxygenase [Cubamyces sp. BRFM 1775]|nr:CyP450 monooxygenase [Cubamyces sp. BRFM 1775]